MNVPDKVVAQTAENIEQAIARLKETRDTKGPDAALDALQEVIERVVGARYYKLVTPGKAKEFVQLAFKKASGRD